MSKFLAVGIPAVTFTYVLFFAVKIEDHAMQNMFQIITNMLVGN